MAQYTGGDIIEITCKHNTLGTFRFQPKSNEDFTLDPGGYRSEDDESALTGGGELIDKINNRRWSVEGPIAVDNASGNEMDNLPKLAASPEQGIWTFTHISGVVWKGKGKPVGDIQTATNTSVMTLKVAGSGRLEKL